MSISENISHEGSEEESTNPSATLLSDAKAMMLKSKITGDPLFKAGQRGEYIGINCRIDTRKATNFEEVNNQIRIAEEAIRGVLHYTENDHLEVNVFASGHPYFEVGLENKV